jgi:peptidyl-prolyl isomerase E (cyclophilin E)
MASSSSSSSSLSSAPAGDDGARSRRTLWLAGLDESATAALVRAACIPFGDISDVQVPIDNKTGKHRGFAFVEFELEADARECVDNLHGAELAGRTLRVTVARPQRAKGQGKAVWSSEAWFKSLGEGAAGAGAEDAAAPGGGADDDDAGGEGGDEILPPLARR